ncbi:MAG: Methylated-DNA--protein-cysteine methyltransferase [Bacteroidota bacterium]
MENNLLVHVVHIDSPLGKIELIADAENINSILFIDTETNSHQSLAPTHTLTDELSKCITQLNEYFEGKRTTFSIQLKMIGTDFQKQVWQQLTKIAFGTTKTYSEQAIALGDIKAIRAVAAANGKNKISIIIPCHRVIGKDGSLTGYAGDLWRKKWLLNHEQKLTSTIAKGKLF